MRQRLVEIETQRSQQATMMAGMRRTCEALRQQYGHLQSSVNERATRSEVSASVRASIDPVRAQVQAALHHYSEGLATATATAAAAVHSANEAKRRAISNHVINREVRNLIFRNRRFDNAQRANRGGLESPRHNLGRKEWDV